MSKYKVGDKVTVVKKILSWPSNSWNSRGMDKTLNHSYTILNVKRCYDDYEYELNTRKDCGRTYGYHEDCIKQLGQMQFEFMRD